MIHELKIQEPFADAVLDGRKTFEVRKNDRGFNTGDLVWYTVVNGGLNVFSHPLNKQVYRIIYVLSGRGIEPEYVVFGVAFWAKSREDE